MNKKVLIPLPASDFDPTEAAIPWSLLMQNSVEVFFATPTGKAAQCDLRMLSGANLGILKPLLVADANAQEAYKRMSADGKFQKPLRWVDARVGDYDGIILPGGHAPGMRPYLESDILQKLVSAFDAQKKIIGAICHGAVLAARSKNSDDKSILFGKKTTALLQSQELTAWGLTKWWLGDYYRTYPMTVEAEVKMNLASVHDFFNGPMPLLRDQPQKLSRGFCVVDGHYLSARWPGDAHCFGQRFISLLKDRASL